MGYHNAFFYNYSSFAQGRREPNVGPGPAEIWRISGFVNSKTDGENARYMNSNGFSGQNRVISKKKKVFSEILTVFPIEFS